MAPRVDIGPANIRDMTFILGALRPADLAELEAQLPRLLDDELIALVAMLHVRPGQSFIAYVDRTPVAAFGFFPLTLAGNVLQAWAFGTRKAPRALRGMIHFILRELEPEWTAIGVTRIEARALLSGASRSSVNWLLSVGAHLEGAVHGWGRGSSRFGMFAWDRQRIYGARIIDRIKEKSRYPQALGNPEKSEASRPA